MQKVVEANTKRMRDIADEPGNVVYEYKYGEAKVFADVEMSLKLAQSIFLERQKKSVLSDDEFRCHIRKADKHYDIYAIDHERTFELITSLQDGPRHFNMLMNLARFKQGVDEHNTYEDNFAQVSNYLLEKCRIPDSS